MPHTGESIEDVAALNAKLERLLSHTDTNKRQREESLANVLKGIETKLAEVAVKADVKPSDPVPAWLKVVAAIGGVLVICITVFGIAIGYGRSDATVIARIQAVETNVQTTARLRDQQQEGMRDRIRSLEQADQVGAERIGTVLQSLATITAQLQAQTVRMEEVLRRQDRLENRLGARPGAAQPPEQPTVYPRPL